MKKILSLFVALALVCAVSAPAMAKKTFRMAYVEWSDAVATANVMKILLEKYADVEVEMLPVAAAAMWAAVADGDVDAMPAAWLPGTHKDYYARFKKDVDNLGPNLKGAKIGWVVPKYVTISSIAEANANADKFDGKIIGIDPGAGLMRSSEKAMKEYDLDDMELVEGSGAAMTATLADAIKHDKWVIVTGWTPHWKFAKYDLKYLDDPKGVFGGEEHVDTVVRKGLKKDMPKAYKILDAFNWTPEQVATVMVWNLEKGADPAKTAWRWIKENPEWVKNIVK